MTLLKLNSPPPPSLHVAYWPCPYFMHWAAYHKEPQRCNLLAKPQRDRQTERPHDSLQQLQQGGGGTRGRILWSDWTAPRQLQPTGEQQQQQQGLPQLALFMLRVRHKYYCAIGHRLGQFNRTNRQWDRQFTQPVAVAVAVSVCHAHWPYIHSHSHIRHLSLLRQHQLMAHVGRFICSSCIQCTFTFTWWVCLFVLKSYSIRPNKCIQTGPITSAWQCWVHSVRCPREEDLCHQLGL